MRLPSFKIFVLAFFCFVVSAAEVIVKPYSHEEKNDLENYFLAQIIPPAAYKVNFTYKYTVMKFNKNKGTVNFETDEMGQFLLKKEVKVGPKMIKVKFDLDIAPMKVTVTQQTLNDGRINLQKTSEIIASDGKVKNSQRTNQSIDDLCRFSEQRRCLIYYFELIASDFKPLLNTAFDNRLPTVFDHLPTVSARTQFFVLGILRHAINQAKSQMAIRCPLNQRDAIALGTFSNALVKASTNNAMLSNICRYGDKVFGFVDGLCEIEENAEQNAGQSYLLSDNQFLQQLEIGRANEFKVFCQRWKLDPNDNAQTSAGHGREQHLKVKMEESIKKPQIDHTHAQFTTSESEHICVICLTDEPQIIFTSCRHLVTCKGCAKTIDQQPQKKCPMCRKHINSQMDISDQPNICLKCRSDKPRVLFEPCKHFCACENCANAIMGKEGEKKCPKCGEKVTKVTHIFTP
ncbi:hypothetical protein niasHT_035739 [Heterodera trifolii]|uniref:RING-type domain-containing protein n=1 Tax=Heterodera trifolii TaxID=157864 RepID=A0ABD2IJA7_9BILA